MNTNENIKEIAHFWGDEAAARIQSAVAHDGIKSMPLKGFLPHCIACGGNWGAMLLTGIKALWPTVWDAIPDDMGLHAIVPLINVLELCGVQPPKD